MEIGGVKSLCVSQRRTIAAIQIRRVNFSIMDYRTFHNDPKINATPLKYFKKSGHCIFADEPENFFSLLKDFLERVSEVQIAYKPDNRLHWPNQQSQKP